MLNFVFSSMNGITEIGDDLVLMLFFALFVVVTVFLAAWFIGININRQSKSMFGKMKASGAVTIIILGGILIRVLLSVVLNGYLGNSPTDQWTFSNRAGMAEIFDYCVAILKNGFGAFSLPNEFPSISYPVPAFMFLFFAKICDIFGGFDHTNITLIMQLTMRLPFILCDAASAVVLYKIAKKHINNQVGLVLAALYMACPVFFFASTVWGSMFSILALPLLLSLYFMTERNFLGLTISFSLALLTSRDAMFLAPIFAVFVVYYFVQSLALVKKSKKLGFKDWFKDKSKGLALRLPLYLICSIAGMYLISLPFLEAIGYSFFGFIKQFFILPFTSMSYTSFNSLSIYNLFGRNNATIGSGIPQWLFSLTFLAISVALVAIIYVSKKNRAIMSLIAPFIVFTLSVFYMGFSELNLVAVLAMLLFSFIFIKDKRILQVFGIVALTVVINASAVMMTSGYFSSAGYEAFVGNYSGSAELTSSTFGLVINAVCTGITMLAFVYFTLIVLDVALSNNIKQFNIKSTGFGSTIKNWLSTK